LIEDLGLDFLVVLKATPELFATEAEKFASTLINALDLRAIVVGIDFRFGRGALGDVRAMRSFASQHGVEVIGMAIESRCGYQVSSTKIRELLAAGRVDMAAELLGRPYAMAGEVQSSAPGRALIQADKSKATPAAGVYRASISVNPRPASQCSAVVKVSRASNGFAEILWVGPRHELKAATPGRACTVRLLSRLMNADSHTTDDVGELAAEPAVAS
jgi:FAD synthase